MEFERDKGKAAKNAAKHGIDFQDAVKVFHDIYAVEEVDRSMDYGEERMQIVGLVNGTMVAVFYVERGDNLRIISARKASKAEQRRYDWYRQK